MNDQQLAKRNPYEVIDASKDQFIKIAQMTGVDFEAESVLAYQQLVKTDYSLKIAMQNPVSVKMAILNVASVGLSLNPATAYAYLVPRDGAICLDISYKGLIKIATDSGSLMWAKAELVYANDQFEYNGPAKIPTHTADPFSKERGEFVGVYCIAKTNGNDFLIETMTADEIYQIRDESSAVKNAKSEAKKLATPWFRYFGEMTKKCVIKRASKTWPKTDQHERIQKAVEVINETEGSDWAEPEKHRWGPGEAAEIVMRMEEYLVAGDDLGVREILMEYAINKPTTDVEWEEQAKFWGLFDSAKRKLIKSYMEDTGYQADIQRGPTNEN